MQTSVAASDHAARFSVPLPATLTLVAGSGVLSLAVSAGVLASTPLEVPWLLVSALLIGLAGLPWAGLAHAIGTRRTFRGCSLSLEAPGLRTDQPVGFRISDPHRRLRRAAQLEISLAWQEIARRVDGRKTYLEGPYALRSSVSWEHQELLPATGGPGIAGSFEVAGNEIRLGNLPEWTQRAEVLVRVRTGRWRSCVFVMPLEGVA